MQIQFFCTYLDTESLTVVSDRWLQAEKPGNFLYNYFSWFCFCIPSTIWIHVDWFLWITLNWISCVRCFGLYLGDLFLFWCLIYRLLIDKNNWVLVCCFIFSCAMTYHSHLLLLYTANGACDWQRDNAVTINRCSSTDSKARGYCPQSDQSWKLH